MSNLLFITTDQQRFDSLKAYGFSQAITPNLDALCQDGVVFENAYVAAPVCVACRSAMMTGLFPSVTGTLGNASWLEDNVPTWPGEMSKQNIKTAGIGKMHFAPWDTLSGFDERIICEDKRHYYIPDDHAKFLEANGLNRISPVKFPNYMESCGAPFYPYAKNFYPDVYIADKACEWISQNKEKPFAAWVSFVGPHDPYDPPQEYDGLYNAEDMPDPIPQHKNPRELPSFRHCDDERPGKTNACFQCDYMAATDAQKKYWRKQYMTNLSIIDEGIGKIIQTLKEQNMYENTTIVFTSDHGDALGDHGLVFKMYYYESMVHVPLIVKGPGVPKGERRSGLVSTCDLVPYFYETMGISCKDRPKMQGKSIGAMIENPKNILHDMVFSEMEGHYMAFDGRYKLSWFEGNACELYDLQEDKNEMNNLANIPLQKPVQERLVAAILEHMAQCNKERTRLAKKTACHRRIEIDKAFSEGKEIFSLFCQ